MEMEMEKEVEVPGMTNCYWSLVACLEGRSARRRWLCHAMPCLNDINEDKSSLWPLLCSADAKRDKFAHCPWKKEGRKKK